MAERRPPAGEAALEAALRRLGAEIAYPPTPPLSDRVVARLRAGTPRRRFWSAPRRVLAVAALLVALLLGLLAASPGVRTALADRLGLRGVEITHLPFVPPPTPTTTPVPIGLALNLGRPTTIEVAASTVTFPVVQLSSAGLGPPEVYAGDSPPGGRLALVYRGPPTVVLVELRGALDQIFLAKGIGPNTRVEAVVVDGGQGFWIDGDPHLVLFRGADGQVHDDQVRLAGSVLLWERGELTLRLEGAQSKEEALRLAASAR